MLQDDHGGLQEKADGLPEAARKPFPPALQAFVFSLAYFLSAEVGYHLSEPGRTSASFWLPAGVYVAALLLSEYRFWPGLAAAALAANLAFDLLQKTPFLLILCFYSANTLQAVLGAWLVRRFVARRPHMAGLREFIGLVAFAGVLSTFPGAMISAAALTAFGLNHTFVESFKILWGSCAMAVLIVSPVILSWFSKKTFVNPAMATPARTLECSILFAALVVLTWHVMDSSEGVMGSHTSRLLPILLWAGLRFGVRGASAANFLFSLLMSFFTLQHLKTLAPDPAVSDQHILTLQMFLAISAVVGLIPAIVLNERDETLAELRKSEEKFSKAFQLSPDVMSIADLETGRYIEVNDVHQTVFGFSREEAIGRSPRELGIVASQVEFQKYEQALKSGSPVREVEVEAFNRRGEPLAIQVSAEILELGGRRYILRVSRDITESKRTEQALRNSEEKFSKAFRTGPDSMTLTEMDSGRYIDVNDGFEKMFGYTRAETVGRTSSELGIWGEGGRAAFLEAVQGTSSLRDREFKMRHRNGNELVVLVSSELIELDGKTCSVSVAHDITEHRKAEAAQRQAEAERNAAMLREQQTREQFTRELIASQEAERRRIAGELHDSLGQNLLLIKNRAQLAMPLSEASPALREQVEGIRDAATQSISEVRQISHDLRPYQLDHLGLARALEAMIENAAQSTAIVFERKLDALDDALPLDAATNLYRIAQECLNNVIKHSQAGRVKIILERDVLHVRFLVEDDGKGFNVEQALDRGLPGGFGLRNIVERVRILNGNIRLDSQPGRGTRIEVEVPVSDTITAGVS